MIRGDYIIQYTEAIALFSLKKPLPPTVTVLGELEKKFTLMATMRNMPNMTRDKMSIRSRYFVYIHFS